MRRREFLAGTAATAAAIAGWSRLGWAQGGGGSPANVSAEKLARIAIMTLDFSDIMKLPWQDPDPDRTLDLFDLPQMYAETYGVHHIEFQHSHLAEAEKTPAFVQKVKSRVDQVKSQISQINLEFGQQNISNDDQKLRQQALDRTRQWIDIAVALGCPRVMINQGQSNLNAKTMSHAIATMKEMNDYGKTKKVMVAVETRGGDPKSWMLVKELVEGAGAYSTIDIGNVGAPNQEAMHAALKGLFPSSSGNMHIKTDPEWDLGTAVRYANGTLGYKGLYSIEVRGHRAVRTVYNTILPNI